MKSILLLSITLMFQTAFAQTHLFETVLEVNPIENPIFKKNNDHVKRENKEDIFMPQVVGPWGTVIDDGTTTFTPVIVCSNSNANSNKVLSLVSIVRLLRYDGKSVTNAPHQVITHDGYFQNIRYFVTDVLEKINQKSDINMPILKDDGSSINGSFEWDENYKIGKMWYSNEIKIDLIDCHFQPYPYEMQL